jgi:ferritin-like metal-binding protein YciE
MAKDPKTLADLFHDTLKDIYYAEKKIVSTLPKTPSPRNINQPPREWCSLGPSSSGIS